MKSFGFGDSGKSGRFLQGFRSCLLPCSAVALLLALGACGGKSVSESDPNALMKEAEEDISSDHYQIAVEKLRTVKNKFPYSKAATEAQLRVADVYYLQESYGEAALAYESFKDLHPKHEKVAYAMFRLAKSYFMDIPDPISRDLTPAVKAQDAFNEFLRRFPNAPEVDEARKDLQITRNDLADKELYIADFYYKRDFYASAKPRYAKIIELYPETTAAATAKTKLAKVDEVLRKHEESLER